MLYLNETDIKSIDFNWTEITSVIESSLRAIVCGEFSQPVKPYLRYGDQRNRIIAMPAYVGREIGKSGIKWIASFPANLLKGIPRAHSVTLLNDCTTGVPLCTINTSLISGIRTAAVSGFVLLEYLQSRKFSDGILVGIIGYGPIGQLHLKMISSIIDHSLIREIRLYDLKGIDVCDVPEEIRGLVKICQNWEECFLDADIFITATVSDKRYIDKSPKKGSLHMNISLRDYNPEFARIVNCFIVDDWDEVCRENTDIMVMHETFGISKANTVSLSSLLDKCYFDKVSTDDVIMFNPMGMATFDIAVANFFYEKALLINVGTILPD